MTLNRRMFLTAAGCAAALGAGRRAWAVTPPEAEEFVRRLIADLEDILRKATPQDPRTGEFLALFKRTTALPQIGQFTMGLTWRQMSEAQKAAFAEAFEGYAARFYANRFNEYEGQEIEVTGSQDVGRRGVLVNSVLKSPGEPDTRVDWLVNDRGGQVLLADIVAEGVSLAITQREEFASMIEKRGGDIDQFIADLEKLG